MQFERLRKSHKKQIIIGALAVCVIGGALTFSLTRAKYKIANNLELAKGTINYQVPDFRVVALYIESDNSYVETSDIPTDGYALNSEKSACKIYDGTTNIEDTPKDNNIIIEYKDGKINFLNISKKNTRCYLYFNKELTSEDILAKLGLVVSDEIPNFKEVASENEGLFKADDYGGDSFYFRGNVQNNYVKFGKWNDDAPDVYIGYNSETSHAYFEYDSLEKCQNSTNGYTYNCTLVSNKGKDMYWRIVRINGDGTIRLIYNGTSPEQLSSSTNITRLNYYDRESAQANDNAGVGYMSGETDLWKDNGLGSLSTYTMQHNAANNEKFSRSYSINPVNGFFTLTNPVVGNINNNYTGYYRCGGALTTCDSLYYFNDLAETGASYKNYHYKIVSKVGVGTKNYDNTNANINDSNIKKYLDNWYKNNMLAYSNYISNEPGFCNDRSTSSGGYNKLSTTYGATIRLNNGKPSFKCINEHDLFTTENSSKGNKNLSYPVGLITADEVVFAGGVRNNKNTDFYLYSGSDYWTMSPYSFNTYYSRAESFTVREDGTFGDYPSGWTYFLGVRPVINLLSNVSFSGNGTPENPYVIQN